MPRVAGEAAAHHARRESEKRRTEMTHISSGKDAHAYERRDEVLWDDGVIIQRKSRIISLSEIL